MDRKRVHAAGEFRRKRCVDQSVSIDPALAAEHIRDNINAVMALPAGSMPGMPRMQM